MRRLLALAIAAALLAPVPAHARLHRDDTAPPAAATHVTVQRGDTLAELADDWPGGWTRAAHVNDLTDPDVIVVGDRLRIPIRDGARWTPPRPTPGASRSWSRPSQSSSSSYSPSSSSTATDGGVWHRLAQCESGGNWQINTGNGYYGGLQFSLSSWRAVGGTGYPHHASAGVQIAMGQRLQARQGWGAWPGCAAKLGLR